MAGTKNKSGEVGVLDLTIKVNDERYPINIYVNNNPNTDPPDLIVYYNPMNPYSVRYANKLKELKKNSVNSDDEIEEFIDNLEYCIDGLFGKGTTEVICSFMGYKNEIITGILIKIEEAKKDFAIKSIEHGKQEKIKEIFEAKHDAEKLWINW